MRCLSKCIRLFPHHTAMLRSSRARAALIVALVAGLFGVCSGAPVHAAKTASLALASKPAACAFLILDASGKIKASGTTPFVGVLPAGRYLIKLQKSGYFTEQRGILLNPGQQRVVQLTLMASGKGPAPTAARPTARPVPGRAQPAARPTPVTRRDPPVARRDPPVARRDPAATRRAPPMARRPVVTARPTPALRPAPARTVQIRVAPVRAAPPTKRTLARPVDQRPSPNTTTITPPSATKKAAKEKPKPGRKIPWIPLAAAAGLGIAGAVFWGLSGGSLSASEDRTKFQRDAFREYQQGRTHRSTAVFLFAAGGAAVGLAAIFYFWNPSKKKKKKKQIPDNSTAVGQLSPLSVKAPTNSQATVMLSTP